MTTDLKERVGSTHWNLVATRTACTCSATVAFLLFSLSFPLGLASLSAIIKGCPVPSEFLVSLVCTSSQISYLLVVTGSV